MKIIGLTGGIASGKSIVSSVFKELGAVILDADQIARLVVLPHQPAWEDIVKFFGPEVVNKDKSLNRAKIGDIVYNNPESLRELNRFTHPRIMQYYKDELRRIQIEQPDAIVILEVPLLYETNMDKLCQQVVVVWVDRETQIRRLMKRDNMTYEDAVRRVEAQMPLDEKVKRADFVIDNRGSIVETKEKATKYYNEILAKA
ncbi:MAG TPA: dephospho-CoA kinase [Syntrophomonas sp.]|jgi:dephospho-CoA kinase|nr:dephospho-CoA kinase [Syntrophomonas sp.]